MNTRTSLTIVFCWIVSITVLAACSKPDPSDPSVIAPEPDPHGISQDDGPEPPVGRLNQPISPTRYRLELRIDPRLERFSGTVEVELAATEKLSGFWLHGKGLVVSEAWVLGDGAAKIDARYEEQGPSGVARVSLAKPAGPGRLTLHMAWSAAFNDGLDALFRIERGSDWYAVTQFEPIAARQVFPAFDEPGFKVPFEVAIISRTGDVAITNWPETSVSELGDGYTRHEFETTRPLPTYLLAFAVGPYDLVDYGVIPPNAIRARNLPLRGIAARGQGEKLAYALKNTAGILGALEDYFGTEYPYPKLDLIAIPTSFGGAMENAGAITYDEYLLVMDETASLEQRRYYATVHAHELAHMWFGDLVTPKWWNDIWLNESFASWMQNKAAQKAWPEGEFDRETLSGALGAMAEDSLAAARQIREPVDRNDAIADAFDGITYQKGGGVLAMLERYVGEERFRDGIRLHMANHADGVADASEFIASVAEGSAHSEIEAAFDSYIEQPGVPLLDVKVNCERGQTPTVQVSQSRYAPLGSTIETEASQWVVPMCVSYTDGAERKSECAMLHERQQTIPLAAADCPSNFHPNADGAGYYRFSMDESWWLGLVGGLGQMPPAEALTTADSLDAAFRAGRVSAGTYVEGMQALVNHGSWDVVEAGLDKLESMMNILHADELPAVEAALGALARPRFDRLAKESGESAELLNAHMQRFLVVVSRDKALRKPLAERAARRVGLNGEPEPDAVPESELQTVLSVGVQDLGAAFFDRLLGLALASEDRAFRNAAFGALARTEEPEQSARLQELVLSGQLEGYEPLAIVNRQMARVATTELTYIWLRKNFEAVMQLTPESFRSQILPGLGSHFCRADLAADWSDFITEYAEKLPGYERSLSQAVESIELCAALRQARAGQFIAAITGSVDSSR